MKVTLAEYGGLGAGTAQQPQIVDTGSLPSAKAEELARLVKQAKDAPAFETGLPGKGRDVITYDITIDDGEGPIVMTQTDTKMSTAFGELKNWIKRHSTGKTQSP
jgi:Emfourin